jgi:hypothetical protein
MEHDTRPADGLDLSGLLGPDIDGLDLAALLARRIDLRAEISRRLTEKARLNGQLRAVQAGTAWPGTPDERALRHERRLANEAITDLTLRLDRIKMRLFLLQAVPKPKPAPAPEPAAPRAVDAERAARYAALDRAGPAALLIRTQRVLTALLEIVNVEVLGEEHRATLRDLAFYLRHTYGKPSLRGPADAAEPPPG